VRFKAGEQEGEIRGTDWVAIDQDTIEHLYAGHPDFARLAIRDMLDDKSLTLSAAQRAQLEAAIEPTAAAGVTAMTPREFAAAVKGAAKRGKALDAAPFSTERPAVYASLPYGQRAALGAYRASPDVNDLLRGVRPGGTGAGAVIRQTAEEVRSLDKIMDRSRLTSDVAVYRGAGSGRSIFGDPDSWGSDLVGFTWRDEAFSSTTTERAVADRFLRDGGPRLRLVVPKDSKAIQLSGVDNEAELLLARGATFRVVKDNGWVRVTVQDRFGHDQVIRVRDLDVEVTVPDETPPLPWDTK
jgi:hypothetical protein